MSFLSLKKMSAVQTSRPPRSEVPLTDSWQFFEPKNKKWMSAQVPGCIHTDFLRHKLIPDPFWGSNELDLQWMEHQDWKYRTTFTLKRGTLEAEHIDLVADGLDTFATVILNGEVIARTENMFTGYRFPVKDRLREGGNELEIRFASPMPYIVKCKEGDHQAESNDPVGGCSYVRKQQCQFGWDWGPRLVTAGVYKNIGLECWSASRIDSLRIAQTHRNGTVKLRIHPEIEGKKAGAQFRSRLMLAGKVVAEVKGLDINVPDPQLWWTNGLGKQPLYDLEVELLGDGGVIDRVSRRIGLRTIELDRHADQWGESFQFLVNGVPIFAKGANWIPAHSFVTVPDRAFYDDLLASAAAAHMNMMRVWGGGIYEMDDFYDLCDEKGIIVWQDFMFACALYPGDRHMLSLIKDEAEYQVKRLSHRASLGLWCGNNEIEQAPRDILKTKARKKAYEDIFYKVLPAAVEKYDGVTPYWPSSPHNPEGWEKGHNNERAGDSHFWDVWHARHPVKRYEEKGFRFCSEFGMQSYSSPEVAATFCPPEQFNVFSPSMENHQKNAAGNQIILDYVSRRYRFPKDYATLAYLSQLNQAYCMKVGIEHFRRSMPRTMGALYWQINDCWPVFSWSSVEFGGDWKALHYEAKRFFAPALISAHVPGDERAGKGNYLISSIHDVNIYTVYDAPQAARGETKWALYHLDGRIVKRGSKSVTLNYGESILQQKLDFAPEIAKFKAGNLVLRVWLEINRKIVSQNTVFLTAPRNMDLPRAPIEINVVDSGPGEFEIEFISPVFQYQVQFAIPGSKHRATDNYFDLYPDIPHRVEVKFTKSISAKELTKRIQTMSLADSY